jgi:hypothetical protein
MNPTEYIDDLDAEISKYMDADNLKLEDINKSDPETVNSAHSNSQNTTPILESVSASTNHNVHDIANQYQNSQDSDNAVYLDDEYAPMELPETMIYTPEIAAVVGQQFPESPEIDTNIGQFAKRGMFTRSPKVSSNMVQPFSNAPERPTVIMQQFVDDSYQYSPASLVSSTKEDSPVQKDVPVLRELYRIVGNAPEEIISPLPNNRAESPDTKLSDLLLDYFEETITYTPAPESANINANQNLDYDDVITPLKVNNTLIRIPADVQSMVAEVQESPVEHEKSKSIKQKSATPADSTTKSISPITPYPRNNESPVITPPLETPVIKSQESSSSPQPNSHFAKSKDYDSLESFQGERNSTRPPPMSAKDEAGSNSGTSYDSNSSVGKLMSRLYPKRSKTPPVSARYQLQNPEEIQKYDAQQHEQYYDYQQDGGQYYDPHYQYVDPYTDPYSPHAYIYPHIDPNAYIDPHIDPNAYVDSHYPDDRQASVQSHHSQYYDQYDPRVSQYYESSHSEYYPQDQHHDALAATQVEPLYVPSALGASQVGPQIYAPQNYSPRNGAPQGAVFRDSKTGIAQYHNAAISVPDKDRPSYLNNEKPLSNNIKRYSTLSQSTERFCCGCFKTRKRCQSVMVPLIILLFILLSAMLFFIYPRAPVLTIDTLKAIDAPVIGTAAQFKAASNAAPFVASFKLLADVSVDSSNYISYTAGTVNVDGLIFDPRDKLNTPLTQRFGNGAITKLVLAPNTKSKSQLVIFN